MKLFRLIEALTEPTAYPYPVQTVEVRQTHISVVFLAGSFVYKVKKPVALGFLDFTTLERRHHFCHEEVRLNRRLAPDVYLSVVPVVRTPGGVRLEVEGEVVEWAVKMRRLPDEAISSNSSAVGKSIPGWLRHWPGESRRSTERPRRTPESHPSDGPTPSRETFLMFSTGRLPESRPPSTEWFSTGFER